MAHWYVRAPDVPGGRWAGRGYTVWQFSAAGRIAGIDGPVDRDWMRGTLAQGTVASIDVQPAEGGVIAADRIACGGRLGFCSRLANPGDAITLRAIPADGVQLVRWTGACAAAGASPTCTVAAFGSTSLSAVFGHPIEVAVPSAETAPVAPGRRPGAGAATPIPDPRRATPTPTPNHAGTHVPARHPWPASSPEGDGDGSASPGAAIETETRSVGPIGGSGEAPPRSRSDSEEGR